MEVNRTRSVAEVRLEGSLDFETVPAIRKRILGISRKKDTGDMMIDLSRVTSVDTAGLALLVEVFMALRRGSRVLRLEGANERVERMIRLASLDRLFEARFSSMHGK